jgi:hypothetical protein
MGLYAGIAGLSGGTLGHALPVSRRARVHCRFGDQFRGLLSEGGADAQSTPLFCKLVTEKWSIAGVFHSSSFGILLFTIFLN